MRMRSLTSKSPAKYPTTSVLPLRVARWLLDSETLARTDSAKRIAGRLLKQPAREGVVEAQSRLGRLLCKECDSQRDRRIGLEMLRQAARAGDCQAQLALGRLYSEARHHEPTQARHWLEQAAAQGSQEARHLLQRQRVRA